MTKQIPEKFKRFFWDIDFARLNPSEKPLFVIQRLLDKGNNETVRWVRNNFSREQIVETFTKIRDFSPKIGNFWALFLDIPREKVLCLQKPYQSMRKSHWPY